MRDPIKRKLSHARYYQQNKAKCNARFKANVERTRKFVQDIKRKSKCVDCGESRWQCLDFDHVDPKQKVYDIKYLAHHGMAIETIQAELDKCVIRCSNCHRIRHFNERD